MNQVELFSPVLEAVPGLEEIVYVEQQETSYSCRLVKAGAARTAPIGRVLADEALRA